VGAGVDGRDGDRSMTTHQSFKRVVRARMAKTGERYAAARRALLAERPPADATSAAAEDTGSYRYRGGQQPLSASLTNVLAHLGVRSPLTGEPLTEATILGIGGGLGAGYILWEFVSHGGAVLTLGFGNRWQYPAVPGWTGTTLERLGLTADLIETGGPKGAATTLDEILATGDPVIAYVDQQVIGTWGQPVELSGYGGYPVVIAGHRDDGRYEVDDRGRAPLLVDAVTMAAARGRIGSFKHRLVHVHRAAAALTADGLRTAVHAGLDDQVEHLRRPSDSFSLPAWRKWARLLTDGRNAKAWPRVFADGTRLFGTLISIVEGVDDGVGATGGHMRDLYATTLDEAAAILDRAALSDAASAWRGAADLWEDLADAAVPPSLPDGLEAIAAAERLHDAVMEGEPGRARATAAARELWVRRDANAGPMALDDEARAALFTDLGERVAAIYEAEVAALDATAAAIGR
jgi:hypothetical protein